jgi:hypothetical protein
LQIGPAAAAVEALPSAIAAKIPVAVSRRLPLPIAILTLGCAEAPVKEQGDGTLVAAEHWTDEERS